MVVEITFENGWIPTWQGSWPWPWIGSYCIQSCISRWLLPTCQISLKSKKLVEDGCTYGHLRPALLGQLCGRIDQKNPRHGLVTHHPYTVRNIIVLFVSFIFPCSDLASLQLSVCICECRQTLPTFQGPRHLELMGWSGWLSVLAKILCSQII